MTPLPLTFPPTRLAAGVQDPRPPAPGALEETTARQMTVQGR